MGERLVGDIGALLQQFWPQFTPVGGQREKTRGRTWLNRWKRTRNQCEEKVIFSAAHPYCMDIETLETYTAWARPLTANDVDI
jgi:hypothetical protein